MSRRSSRITSLKKGFFSFILIGFFAMGVTLSAPDSQAGFYRLQRLDFVNMGSPESEAEHEAAGWGPTEPDAHGGGWGGIDSDECDLPYWDSCDKKTRVTWAGDCSSDDCLPPADMASTNGEPDSYALFGRAARVVLDPNGGCWGWNCTSYQLRLRVLDGIGYDAFDVYVRNIKKDYRGRGRIPAKLRGDTLVHVYRFDPYSPENIDFKQEQEIWRVHVIDLTAYDAELNLRIEPNSLEVIIQAIGHPWNGFATYGQLAVDWVELRVRCRRRR
jgi:hypothetical protein